MELKFPGKCQNDDLLKATTIASCCIEEIENLCAIEWDDPQEGVCSEAGRLGYSLEALTTLAQHGWELMPRLCAELTLAADGVVTVCGVVATSAHEAVLRLADNICCEILSTFTLVPPGDYRGPYVNPESDIAKRSLESLARPELEECEPLFQHCKSRWQRKLGYINSQEIEVLSRRVQREYQIAKNHRAKLRGKLEDFIERLLTGQDDVELTPRKEGNK
jgi:hypothetical protein